MLTGSIGRFEGTLHTPLYTQGFNGVPLYLLPSANSGFNMRRHLGFGYSRFLMHFRDGQGDMSYLERDLDRIWEIVQRKLRADPQYLKRIRRAYQSIVRKDRERSAQLDGTRLSSLSERVLLNGWRFALQAQVNSVGDAHVLEAIGLRSEMTFKRLLLRDLRGSKELHTTYAILTTPSEPSFLAKEQANLDAIRRVPRSRRDERLRAHQRTYGWITNSYLGPKPLSIAQLRRRLHEPAPVRHYQRALARRQRLLQSLALRSATRDALRLIDFATAWQDERKANILRAVETLGRFVREISRRWNIDPTALGYLGYREAMRLTSFRELGRLAPALRRRRSDSWYLIQPNREDIVDGQIARRLGREWNALVASGVAMVEQEIHGTVANGGTVIGTVRICNHMNALPLVRSGDILVASMTRPEYMPALRRAAAIVTDEGGMTCHAAIVARELNLPAVIGLRVATKVLRDGDLVEVRANHGIIRILERA